MNKKYRLAIFIILFFAVVLLLTLFLRSSDIAVLNPAGQVADKERDLIITTTLLMLIIVIPVLVMTFFIAWKYRASNHKAKYSPSWDHNRAIECSWWAIPSAIIAVLAVIAWNSSHELDPFRPIVSDTKPLTVQVVALQWKWLFIYPEQDIATVNYVEFPQDTPINFEITSDAPMNSFWIPKLGGQVYAMAGMKTKLHLIADEPGSHVGSSANISGEGFAGMHFIAKSSSQTDFEAWVQSVKQEPASLTLTQYNQLAKPSKNSSPAYFASTQKGLQDIVVSKYLAPQAGASSGGRHQH